MPEPQLVVHHNAQKNPCMVPYPVTYLIQKRACQSAISVVNIIGLIAAKPFLL